MSKSQNTLKPRSLLIVDDEPDLRAVLKENAETELGCEVVEAENGKVAIELLRARMKANNPIDAVISDIAMPVMNGIDFLKQMRSEGFATPCIVLTAHGDKATTVAALQLGAFAFVDKPFEEESLLTQIDEALEVGVSFRSIEDELDTLVAQRKISKQEEPEFRKIMKTVLMSKKMNRAI